MPTTQAQKTASTVKLLKWPQFRIVWLLLFVVVLVPAISHSAQVRYAVAAMATPVLNSPDFPAVFGGSSGTALKVDRCGMVRELEFVALPGTVFTILKELRKSTGTIYQVLTDDYQAASSVTLYIDRRFVTLHGVTPEQRHRVLPARKQIEEALLQAVGNRYVWGGNISGGVPQLKEWFYNDAQSVLPGMTLAGVDCSGLLYQATGGWTPRNSSQLLAFGTGVQIAGKSADEIAKRVKPLDLIVWDGHVVIVLDQNRVIESRLVCGSPMAAGVVVSPLVIRLQEIMTTRRAADSWGGGERKKRFVVRRWYPADDK